MLHSLLAVVQQNAREKNARTNQASCRNRRLKAAIAVTAEKGGIFCWVRLGHDDGYSGDRGSRQERLAKPFLEHRQRRTECVDCANHTAILWRYMHREDGCDDDHGTCGSPTCSKPSSPAETPRLPRISRFRGGAVLAVRADSSDQDVAQRHGELL